MFKQKVEIIVISHNVQDHYCVGFVNGLADNDVSVDFITSKHVNSGLRNTIHSFDLGQNTSANGHPFVKMVRLIMYHLRLIFFVMSRCKRNIHVIGLFRYEWLTGIMEGLLFKLLGKNYIITVHNVLPHNKKTRCNIFVYKLIYRIPDWIIVHTNNMKSELIEKYGIKSDKIIIMQHGINDVVPETSLISDDYRRLLNLPDRETILLFFGQVWPYKGLDILLDAIENVDDIFLIIAGNVQDPLYRSYIENKIETHPKRGRIIGNLSFIPNDKIPLYFGAASVCVMPYRQIDQSGVLFLALRYGTPVIAFDVGSLREYIPDQVGIIVSTSSTEHLAHAIDMFKSQYHKYNREEIKRYAERFKWKNVVIPVIEIY